MTSPPPSTSEPTMNDRRSDAERLAHIGLMFAERNAMVSAESRGDIEEAKTHLARFQDLSREMHARWPKEQP